MYSPYYKNCIKTPCFFFFFQVELRCSLPASHLSRKDSAAESEQGLLVSGLYLEGASFDFDRVCLVEAK